MRHLVVLPLVALVLGGCGGAGGDADADPATALPPSGAYVELVINPQGDQREAMEALAGKLLRTDEPGRRIVELLEEDEPGGGGEFERDVKPWLGRRAGLALTSFGEDEQAGWTAAVAAEDAGQAAEAIERVAEREGGKRASHEDVDYWVDGEGEAIGVAGDFVLISDSETGLRRAIDARGGKSLAALERFKDATEPLPDGRAGTIFFDLATLLEQSPSLGGAERQLLTFFTSGFPPTALAVLAEADALAIESRAAASGGSSLASLITGLGYLGSTPLLGELPGESWVAVGLPRFGETARGLVAALAGPLGGPLLGGRLESELGISLERDVYAWIGDVALFVRGDSVADAGGGVVVEAKDPARARAALPRLLGALRLRAGVVSRPVALDGATSAFAVLSEDLPQPVYVAIAKSRVVVAYGRGAALAALGDGPQLRDSDAWRRAQGVLDGLEPVVVVDARSALRVAEQAAAGDPGFARAKPYLETVSVIAGGSRRDGDRVRSRLAAGVE